MSLGFAEFYAICLIKIVDRFLLLYPLDGIVIEYVSPKYSSKKCWKCGEFGSRDGKKFVCISSVCGNYQLDSDLNAARNLVRRSKKYP